MIRFKDDEEIEIMAEGGKILGKIFSQLEKEVRVGMTTLEIDKKAERLIKAAGGEPSFKKVPNYYFSTCLCVNEIVVHGVPSSYQLKEGDLLGIDVGFFYKGFHTDTARTVIIGKKEAKKRRFLKTGEQALEKAIRVTQEGSRVGDISQAIQETIERNGYSVVRSLVGHGIGRKLHEDPQIPGFLNRKRTKTPILRKGMTLAIEVIYNMGSPEVVYGDDGWTISTQDRKISGLFEKTIVVTNKGPIVLTV